MAAVPPPDPGSREGSSAWNRSRDGSQLPTDVARYGPDTRTESELRLLGHLGGKRVLDLGCGAGQCSIAFAKQGATAVGVDCSAAHLAVARRLVEREGVRVELHHGDLADLAFLRAESIDVAFSAYALGSVEDVGRVFRQVHRVLKVGSPLVVSLPHPAYDLIDEDSDAPLAVRRSYFDQSPIVHLVDGVEVTRHHHTIAELHTALVRSSYRVDTILEPEPTSAGPRSAHWREAFRWVPRTLLVRARKEGG